MSNAVTIGYRPGRGKMPGMWRVGRTVINLATGASVLLCLATVAVWARSYAAMDCLERSDARVGPASLNDAWIFAASRGELFVWISTTRPPDGPGAAGVRTWHL